MIAGPVGRPTKAIRRAVAEEAKRVAAVSVAIAGTPANTCPTRPTTTELATRTKPVAATAATNPLPPPPSQRPAGSRTQRLATKTRGQSLKSASGRRQGGLGQGQPQMSSPLGTSATPTWSTSRRRPTKGLRLTTTQGRRRPHPPGVMSRPHFHPLTEPNHRQP